MIRYQFWRMLCSGTGHRFTRMPRPRRSGAARNRPAKPRDVLEREQGPASPPRIIGGTLRGRRLEFVSTERTRPMKDRVRETLFDLLGVTVRDSLVIDLFAGTGALGFEAMSRGAARALFAERHFPTAAAIRRSAAALGIADRVEVRPGDVLLWPRRMPEFPVSARWIAFVSPPWAMFRDRSADVMSLVTAIESAAPAGSVIVVESDTAFDTAALPGADRWRSRAIPPAALHLLTR